MISDLPRMSKAFRNTGDLLLERRIIDGVPEIHILDTLGQIDISGCSKSDNMRVFRERFEGHRIMHLVVCVAVIM
jgi:hypothetical protein